MLLWLLPFALLAAGCSGDDLDVVTDESGSGSSSTTLTAPGLSWSASTCEAYIGATNTFPTLTNPYSVTVSYTSSSTGVATISSTGALTLVGQGTTVITAASAETSKYEAASVSYTLTVLEQGSTLVSPELSWPAASYSAVLGSAFTSPVLTNPHGVAVSYSSSNTSVATVSSGGIVTIVAAGTTNITASSVADDTYFAGSAYYTLSVTSDSDDGAVTTNFPSSGDTSSDDDISNTTFTRLVTVTFASGGASVSGYSGASSYFTVSVSGNKVSIDYTGSENVAYKLTGTASDGYFKLSSTRKQAIWLSSLNLTCTSGAAINNQSGKRTFVYVDGTNKLTDGSSASYTTTGTEDMKGVFFSEGQLVFSGSGSLSVTANNAQGKSGIVSDDYVRFMSSPSVTVSTGTSAGHGVKANDYVQISNGTLDITTKAAMKKGIASDNYVLVEGGTSTITVSGGTAYDSDAKEYKGSAGIKADNYFAMTDGKVTIKNTGAGGKGIRAGSYDYDATSHTVEDSYISGGTLNITTSGSETNDVSAKGMKIGWVTKSGSGSRAKVTAYAGNLLIKGGSVNVSASKSEGIEAKGNIVISGGDTYVYSSGDDAINSQAEFDVTGGYIYAHSTANDGMDANHDMKISGGYVLAVTTKGSPELAMDANTEERYKLYITGGVVIAYGGLESGYSASNTVYSMSATAGSWNALHNGSSYIAAFKAPSGLSTFAVCAPSLSKGYKGVTVGSTTYSNGSLASTNISGGTSVSLSTYSGGGGPGGRW